MRLLRSRLANATFCCHIYKIYKANLAGTGKGLYIDVWLRTVASYLLGIIAAIFVDDIIGQVIVSLLSMIL
jgi:hypothetical protein